MSNLHSIRRWKILASALCAALLLGMISSYVLLLGHGDAGTKQTDFVPYFSAGSLTLGGHGAAVYDLSALGKFERVLVHPLHVRDGVMPFLYPPHVALAFAPLAALPYNLAFLTWLLVNMVLLVASLVYLARFADFRRSDRLLFWLASLAFFPVLVALSQGQTSILLLAGFTGCFLALRSGHPIAAGLALSIVLIKPQYVIPLLLLLVIQQRWRALVGFAVGASVYLLASLVVFGGAGTGRYLSTGLSAIGWQTQIGGFEPKWNQSFLGFTQLLMAGPASKILVAAVSLVALAAVAWKSRDRGATDSSYALGVIVGLLVSPHVLVHDLSVLLVPATIALTMSRRDSRPLSVILAGGFAAPVIGIAMVGATHVQFSVLCMLALGVWLLSPHSASLPTWRGEVLHLASRSPSPEPIPLLMKEEPC